MQFDIREFDRGDTEILRQVFLDSRAFAFNWGDPDRFKLRDFDRAIKGEAVLVAIHIRRPIGFIAWWPPENFIHSLFVDPLFLHRGVGSALLKAGLARMGRPASLKCLKRNRRALEFYLDQGWTIASEGRSDEGEYFLLTYNDSKAA